MAISIQRPRRGTSGSSVFLIIAAVVVVLIAGLANGTPSPSTNPEIDNGGSLLIPQEVTVDLVGGATGVERTAVIRIPDGVDITLPASLSVDIAGGDTGVESRASTEARAEPAGRVANLPQ